MNIAIFGATGGTGRALVEQALAQGHTVTTFARNPAGLAIGHPRLTVVQGDVLDPAMVEAAVDGPDAVLNSLGMKPGTQAAVTSQGTQNIIAAIQKFGVRRLIQDLARRRGRVHARAADHEHISRPGAALELLNAQHRE